MKILILSHKFYPDIGGIEVNSEILAKGFINAGHDVRLLTWTRGTGIRHFPFLIIRKPTISKLFREHHWADIVFENNPALRLAWPSFFLNNPNIVALCTWITRSDGKIGWQDKFKFWWLTRAAAVIAVSESVRTKCFPSATVISNPYNNKLFRILPDIKKNINFVFLGRLVSDKGSDLAIKAIAKLLSYDKKKGASGTVMDSGFSLTIIGNGPELTRLKNLAADLGIADKIDFKGALKGQELVRCLNMHRFILVPSVWEEPFGNVALEGMACGCVPIVSDGGGLPDAVGDAGLIFNRGDVSSLVECIIRLLNDNQLEQQLRSAAQFHLPKHFPDTISKLYLSVFERHFSTTPEVHAKKNHENSCTPPYW